MAGLDSSLIFLGVVALISISGVIMPGPVFAATVAKGYSDPMAGVKIALGHVVVEIPLFVAIFLGLDYIFQDNAVFAAIGITGGIFLAYMGYSMIRTRKEIIVNEEESKYGAFMAGIITTVSNPYFFLWWATVGAALIATALEFGLIILPFFILVHISCDFLWEHLVSFSIYRTRGFWSQGHHHLLFMLAGAIMLVFGIYFVSSSIIGLI